MKDIFSDLYDRVLSFFNSQTQDDTKVVAKSRLKTVLMQDRVGFSERAMQMLKDDLLNSISKYLEINNESFDLSIDATEEATILNLSIPVLRTKTDSEIDEAICLKEEAQKEKTKEIVGELQELVKEKAQALADKISEEKEEIDEEEDKEDTKVTTSTKKSQSKKTKKDEDEDEDEILDNMLKD